MYKSQFEGAEADRRLALIDSINEQLCPKRSGTLPLTIDSIGGNLSDWTIYGNTEGVGEKQIVKGNLPLDFVSDGTTLENCRIYGTAGGAGVQTENYGYTISLKVTSGTETKSTDVHIGDSKLFAKEYVDYEEQKVYKRTENLFDKDDCGIIQVTTQGDMRFGTEVEGLTAGTYTLSFNKTKTTTKIYLESRDNEGNYRSVGGDVTSPYTFSLAKAPAALIVRTNISSDSSSWEAAGIENMMLTEGSAPPETYIPYLQPTNPPLPLPAIETFGGDNILDSTETLGEVTITQGYIVPLDIYSLSDTNEINFDEVESRTRKGITYTVDKEAGTITANGTAEEGDSGFGVRIYGLSGDFMFSGAPEGGNLDTYYSYMHDDWYRNCEKWDGTVLTENDFDYGNGQHEVHLDNHQFAYAYYYTIIIKAGYTCDNLVFKPTLIRADISSHKDICTGSTPLTEGQSVSRDSTGIEIEVEQGTSVIETTLTNKPEMDAKIDRIKMIEQALISMQSSGGYNETQTDYITDNVEEVTQ